MNENEKMNKRKDLAWEMKKIVEHKRDGDTN